MQNTTNEISQSTVSKLPQPDKNTQIEHMWKYTKDIRSKDYSAEKSKKQLKKDIITLFICYAHTLPRKEKTFFPGALFDQNPNRGFRWCELVAEDIWSHVHFIESARAKKLLPNFTDALRITSEKRNNFVTGSNLS